VIAWYFGLSIDTDLYFYIVATITLMAGFINGMDLAVIIPEGMHLKVEKGFNESMQFYNFFGFLYLLAGILVFLLLFFFSVPLFSSISSFSTQYLSNHSSLLLLGSGLPLMIILSNYLGSVLTTLKYFSAPLVGNGIAHLFALGSLLLFQHSVGINAVLAGMIAGYLLNIILLLVFMKTRLNWHFSFSILKLSKTVKRNLVSVQLGNLTTVAYNYGIILLLSSLATGIYSAYNYGMQIVNVPNTFVVAQVAAVAGIKFNELAAKKLYEKMNRIFMDSLNFLMFLMIPICFLSWLYADTIVNILFVRGTFTKESAVGVVLFIKYFIFLLPCMAINTFLSRLLISVKKVNESFYFQVGFNVFILLCTFTCTKMFGLNGFIWSILLVNYFYFSFICIFLMKWIMPYIEYKFFLKQLLKIILLNLPLFIGSYFFFKDALFIIPFIYIGLLFILNNFFKVTPGINFNIKNLT
jgi:peptidoglycan biosynthesis protein MviN/MurJ (putative lipid II flippase)